ncbi:23S rRNA (pseudouridine(1915)-N(3))-methyltransferase RlmH [Wenzhouxiangella sp. XN24]|uniref:23S rRNA (pseudouridine(1915)-N(3))-methyltransferase RlmH n=1 Tax=Wenzhouxiangella sp. XN24 TaxID=2713569 RepID=UPI0013ECDE0E|nr:23S rRNA (pseudouridine(1915)-N(3))-methyltransferase RlmH [Wenzhouxiangella sp. XN24]
MRLRILAVGSRMPGWVDEGCRDYAARMPRECRLEIQSLPLGRRSRGSDTSKAVADEGRRLLAASEGCLRVCLDVPGVQVDTPGLARKLADWRQDGRDVALLVGGPDGLAASCLDQAQWRWSLSHLTLPHGLVRVLLAEQLYRAWTILSGHPYHRQ